MTSPFPGMDPYLEDPAFWPDFHSTFLTFLREAIEDELPGGYDAQIGESVNLIQMSPEVIKLIYPDIAVTKQPGRSRLFARGRSARKGRFSIKMAPGTQRGRGAA